MIVTRQNESGRMQNLKQNNVKRFPGLLWNRLNVELILDYVKGISDLY